MCVCVCVCGRACINFQASKLSCEETNLKYKALRLSFSMSSTDT